jgi:hypothetical protein
MKMSQVYHMAFATLILLTMVVFVLLFETKGKYLAILSLLVAVPIMVFFDLKHREALNGERLAMLVEIPAEKFIICQSQIKMFQAAPLAREAFNAFEECVFPEQFAKRREKEKEIVLMSAIVASF